MGTSLRIGMARRPKVAVSERPRGMGTGWASETAMSNIIHFNMCVALYPCFGESCGAKQRRKRPRTFPAFLYVYPACFMFCPSIRAKVGDALLFDFDVLSRAAIEKVEGDDTICL